MGHYLIGEKQGLPVWRRAACAAPRTVRRTVILLCVASPLK